MDAAGGLVPARSAISRASKNPRATSGSRTRRREIRDALDRAVRSADAPLRVRLLLAADGAVRVEHTPLDQLGDGAHACAACAGARSIPSDDFLYHKTTNRAVYERARRPDCDDVILWNPAGEVTETTIANLVVEDVDGAAGGSRRRLPAACCPARCAPSCWRRGEVSEARVTVEQLQGTRRGSGW